MHRAPGAVTLALPHRLAGHCGSGAMRDLLEFNGLSWTASPLSEGACFGLGSGLGLAFAELDRMEPPLYLVGRTAGLERDICAHLDVELDFRQSDDPQEGWRWLHDELDAGRPTMVWADIGELDYLQVRMQMTMHDIVVCGYDETAGVALVADNDRAEIQRVALDSLARARNSKGFPAPNRHATFLMRFPESLPDVQQTIRTALQGAVTNMRAGGAGIQSSGGQPGLEAARDFTRSYETWPERFGEQLESALRGLSAFVVKAGTGGALFRSLHADFLRDASELLGDPRLANAARRYDLLAETWIELAGAARAGDHGAGLERARAIPELEEEGVTAMEAALA